MALNDIVGKIPPKFRRALVTDVESGSAQSLASRLTTHMITFHKVAADSMASDTTDDAFYVTQGEMWLLKCSILPHAALTSNDTNYATVSVWDGTNTYFTKNTTTAQGSWVDNTEKALAPVPVDQIVADAVTLRFRIQKAASGVVVPVLVLQLLVAERIA